MLVMAVSFPWPGGGWHARRPGGQHCEESGRQARIRSHPSGWRAGGGRGPGRQVNPKAPGPMTSGSDPDRSHHAVDRGGLSSGRQVRNRASRRRNQGSDPHRDHHRDHRSGISTCRGVRLSGTADRTSPTTAWPQASLASARTGTEPSSTSPLLHPGPKPGLISRSDLVVVQPGPLDTAALTAGPAEVPAHGWATISTTITAYRTRPSTVIQ
jgi:hypothetical protein